MAGSASATKNAKKRTKAKTANRGAPKRADVLLASTYIVDLPAEVWDKIFVYFSLKAYRPDHATLRALVLVNKFIKPIATAHLYAAVDWAAYDTLLAHPEYAAMVKFVYPRVSKEDDWAMNLLAAMMANELGGDVPAELFKKKKPPPMRGQEKKNDKEQIKKLAKLLPTLTSLENMDVRVQEEDVAWLSRIPNPLHGGPIATRAQLPAGLHNLAKIHIAPGGRQDEEGLDVSLLVPLFFLPSIRKLNFTYVATPSRGWSQKEKERLRTLAGTSSVTKFTLDEDGVDFNSVIFLLSLPRALESVRLDVDDGYSLPVLTALLAKHKSTLRRLELTNSDCDETPRTDVLGSLVEFIALRRLDVETNQLLSIANRAGSIADVLPPNLEHLELALNNTEKRARRAALARQMLEVVQKTAKLKYLKIMGDELDDIEEKIEGECEARGIELDVEVWPKGPER